ncbi:regulator of protease activity HflC (stomatin/prohibitin superfamily) [Peribacillus deserti]|uniref:Regulator of protease activity HflC (Stomatin/prohibitin superfamily) n=1 Tax=Peribacillus deserti TaxID=673318 RepID=A0ABS2QH11_9BACI|nr:slipin family protein [Peribacillus deserti]MBM7691556.1 regulator of protease activity HflC (stomatin/prohibitin superfamily) [Peribacillus deserti]
MFDIIWLTAVTLIGAAGLWFLEKIFIRTKTIYEYERGIRFHKGKSSHELIGPGRYTYFTAVTRMEVFDLRPAILQLTGQEVLTRDNLSVKFSLVVTYQILDPKAVLSQYENFKEYLYLTAQLRLREVISAIELDELLQSRQLINDRVKEILKDDQTLSAFSIISVDVKDIMLSAELKKIYSEAVKVKKETNAALEKARGEMAVLRSLANSAKLLEKNPELGRLRLIQTIESSQGNTFVINTGKE